MTGERNGRRWPGGRARALAGAAILLAAAAGGAALLLRGGQAAPPRGYTLVTPRPDTLVATVSAAGQIEPDRTVDLTMPAAARVAEVLVQVGQRVTAGQTLARADDRELALRLAQAQAQLDQAQASYDKLRAGATESDLAVAKAQLDQARGQLLQVSGGVTPADLAAARAQLDQATAALSRITGNPRQSDVDAARARIRDAELTLQSQRDQLSAAKTNAGLQRDQAVAALTQAQARYATAKQNWEYAQSTGNDPIRPRTTGASGQSVPNRLTDGQRQQYYDAFVQAEAALRSAEQAVAQAQVGYDSARSAEANGVERAEGQLVVAQSELAQLTAAPEPDALAAARAQVAAAQANLAKLGGDQRAGALQAASAAVALADARLAQLAGGPLPADVRAAEGQLASAKAARDLAALGLEGASITAPFDGEVAEVNLKVGELPSPALPAVVLTDRAQLHVTVTVDEVDIARIAAGQPVSLTLDALPGVSLAGRVSTIAPLAVPQAAVPSYRVQIAIAQGDPRARPGMSTNTDIIVARREGALVLPRRALRSDRGKLVVDVPKDPGLCALPRERLPERPELVTREVQVGLTNEQLVEVAGGVGAQECVYVEGVETRVNPLSGPPPGVRGR